MQFHRLACLILGIWLGGSVLVDVSAVQNFRTVGRVLTSIDLRVVEGAKTLGGQDAARQMLRHFAGEANRYMFEQWEWAELLIGLLLMLVLLFGHSYQKFAMALCLLMMLLVAGQRFQLTPSITAAGRLLDFSSASSARFNTYHALYGYVEVGKLILGLVLGGRLIIRRKSDRTAFAR